MRLGRLCVVLLLALASLLAGCVSNSGAYPNDQAKVVKALSDKGFNVRVESATEEMLNAGHIDPFALATYVTIAYAGSGSLHDIETSALPAIRRAVWEVYPHRLERLTVWVSIQSEKEGYYYNRADLEKELGKQGFREADSGPSPAPLSDGYVVAIALGCIAAAGFVGWMLNLKIKRQRGGSRIASVSLGRNKPKIWPPSSTPPSPVGRPEKPDLSTAGNGGRAAPSPLSAHQAAPVLPGPRDIPPPSAPSESSESGDRKAIWLSFDETRIKLNDIWQQLAGLAPKPPRRLSSRDKAKLVDEWLANHSGVPIGDITAARDARNDAIHEGEEITRATMRRALETLEEVAARLYSKIDGKAR